MTASESRTIGQILFETLRDSRPHTLALEFRSVNGVTIASWGDLTPYMREQWEIASENFMQAWERQVKQSIMAQRKTSNEKETAEDDPGLDTDIDYATLVRMVRQHEQSFATHSRDLLGHEIRLLQAEAHLGQNDRIIVGNNGALSVQSQLVSEHEQAIVTHGERLTRIERETIPGIEAMVAALMTDIDNIKEWSTIAETDITRLQEQESG